MWYAIECDGSVYADQNSECRGKERVLNRYRTLRELAIYYPRAFVMRDDMPTLVRAKKAVAFVNN